MDAYKVFLLVAISLALLAGFVMFEQSYEENLDRQDHTNESINISSTDTPLNLTNSQIDGARYDDTVTAYNTTGIELSEPGDYTWYEVNGSIEFNSSSTQFSAGENATVTYGYLEPSSLQYGILQLLGGWLGVIVFVVVAVVALSVLEVL